MVGMANTMTNLADATTEHITFCTKRYAKRHGMKVSDVRRIPVLVQCALYEVDQLGSLWHPDANGIPVAR
jgi:hypothetical protein